jgi:acyl-CoA synthetase (NDP forming)
MNSQSIIEKAKSASRTLLNEIESKALLSEAGVPVVETKFGNIEARGHCHQ